MPWAGPRCRCRPPALAGPAISFAARLLGAPNAQIWMADVPIGLEPDVRADRRVGARSSCLSMTEGDASRSM
jgi:hypothetical protein